MVIQFNVLQASLDVLRGLFVMRSDEAEIAQSILLWLLLRHHQQITQLQTILGVSNNFEAKVNELWKKANTR